MTEFRWLQFHMSDIGSNHPSGFYRNNGFGMVLQTREVHKIDESSIQVADTDWTDIPIVMQTPPKE